MDQPNDKRRPQRPPPIISDAEVDRLLNQAQSLTDEIIAEVGVNAIEDREAAPQLGGPEPEPNSAVDLVSHDLAELKETIEEVSPEIQQALLDALAESDAAGPSAMEAAGGTGLEENAVLDDAQQDHAEEESPRISAEMEAALQAALAEDAASPPVAAADGAAAEASATTETIPESGIETQTEVAANAAQPAAPAVSEEASPAEAEASRPRRMLVTAALIVPNALLKTIELLDRPFARIPSAAKNAMGAAGVASLLMGVAAVFMPKLMQSNPYATMEPLPHPVEVESHDEHGGGGHEGAHEEGAKESHEEAPKEAHEEKPTEHEGGHH